MGQAKGFAATGPRPNGDDRAKRGVRWFGLGLALATTVGIVSASAVRAAEGAACPALEQKFVSERAELAAPQVSALLFSAADAGCAGLTAQLLHFGASPAARDRTGGTALTHAARSGQAAVIRLLVDHGAAIDERNVAGSTPLYVAVERNQMAAAEALLSLGAKVDIAGRGGVTPLSAAAYNGNAALVDLLLGRGADPNVPDTTGKVAIVYAAARGFTPVVTRLLASGVAVDARYAHDLTPLMWAAGHADDVASEAGVAVVRLLLDKGAAIDLVDDRGRTALMTAAERGHGEIVDLLLRHGAGRDRRDKNGQSAADLTTSPDLKDQLAAR